MKRALILAALITGCAEQTAAPEPAVEVPAAAPVPVVAKPRPTPRLAPRDTPDAVTRDTEALRDQATQYVVRRDSDPAIIDRLAISTLRARKASERAQATKRAGDVIAARAAADALAALIAARTQAP